MYKKIRFYYRLTSALAARYYPYIILGLVISIFVFFSAPYIVSRLSTFRFTRTVGVIGRYTLTDLPPSVTEKISLGLTTVDPFGRPGPGIARAWEILPDGRSLQFTLNTDLVWHNGAQLKSSDIKYQFQDAVIEYPDSSRIIFQLKDLYSPLPALLSKPVILFQTSNIFKSTRVLGLGSYRVKSFKSSAGVIESLTLYPVKADSRQPIIQYNFYLTSQQARTAYKLGLVDYIEDLPDLGDIANWPNTEIGKSPAADRYVGLFFNTQSPNLTGASGKNLRFAIAYAINKDNWSYRSFGSLRPENWALNPEVKKYDQDINRSADLLKKVEKLPDKIIINTVPAYISVAEQIKADLSAVGLNTEISVARDVPAEFDLLLIAQSIPLDPDQYPFWHSTQSTNLTRLNNPRIDKLLEDGRRTYDQDERIKIYQDFQKYLAEEIPVVFLFYPEIYSVSRK